MSPTREALFALLEAARVQSRAIRDLCKIVSDLQQQISDLAAQAGQYESQASQAEANGDKQSACSAYRNAASAWRDAASAGTSLIVETLNDSNLDPDAVNENVHIMANNAEADDQSAAKVCN